jgi:hypothetical protein
MLFSSVFVAHQPRRRPLFSFIGEVSAQSASPSPVPTAANTRPSRHTHARDEKQLPLSSSKTRRYKSASDCDTCKSFKIRSYENCRVSPTISSLFSSDLQLSPLNSRLPQTYALYFQNLAHSFAHFCAYAKPNSFVFNRFRTLSQKHLGVGIPVRFLGAGH